MDKELFLVQRNGTSVLSAVKIGGGEFLVGRSSQAAIVVPHASVSRRHALLTVTDSNNVQVRDLQSRNGTFVDGQRIDESQLQLGQQVKFGGVAFTLSLSPMDGCEMDSNQDTRGRTPEDENEDRPHETFMLPVKLTPAQDRVFRQLLTGLLEKQIAAKLKLSQHTVHNHARAIYAAYGVHSRAELLLRVLPEARLDQKP